MMVALVLHLGVALAIVAWPGALPSLEDVRTVEVMFTQPAPPPEPEPARAEPPPRIKPVPPAPATTAAKPVRAAPPKPAPAVSAAAAPSPASADSVSADPQTPAAAAAAAAVAPPSPPVAAASPPANPDTPPLALDMPRPTYPRMAKQRGWQGLVVLVVEVNELGCANTVTVKQGSGHAMLDESAVEAVRRWHFRPARKDGRDTVATVEIPIRFSLSDA